MQEFIHLHNHTHYSVLDAICRVEDLVNAAVKENMRAVAITDHGVMYGAMEFYKMCKQKGIKPIIGIETYVVLNGNRFDRGRKIVTKSDTAELIDDSAISSTFSGAFNYAHLILLAKNEIGYKNLIKLNSIAFTEGFYNKPRIDLEVLNKYKEGLVALSACLHGVVSLHIVNDDIKTAKKVAATYKEIFGEDFYLEIQNHITIEAEKKVLKEMPKIAKETGIKLIATNDVHYINKSDAVAHNIYLHIGTQPQKISEAKDLLTNLRYGTDQIYFKSSKEMIELFKEFPEAIKSTLEVTEKCNINLDTSQHYMPNFPVPDEDKKLSLDDYLKKISYEGLKQKFKNITADIVERLEYELNIISKMKFSGYFLIVQDFIRYAKSKGILVGPGRGSAAGSLVCYCIGITSVNPLEYNLLFERFLNPERISMPDIDIDFQDDRRDEIIKYAKEKYGANSVAQIITFNKLAPRGVLKDVGRVLNLPFNEINNLTKLVPILFGKIKSLSDCYKEVEDFKNYFDKAPKESIQIRKNLYDISIILENLNRNISIHASGIVIAPSDITNFVPLARAKDHDKKSNGQEQLNDSGDNNSVYCTQYDMNMLEDAGLIKMDFLGLKELKVIQRTIELIKKQTGKIINIDEIPLDDAKTYELFSSGATTGIFQFSKSKMKEYLSKLKPKNINDLAMMNALYRPGPMKLIPDVIEKKFGRKPITYMHPKMENALKETYGTIVYQEQVMQIAREIAGFTMSQADNMRKAMGKKIKEKMKQIKSDFIEGAIKNGVKKNIAEDIFKLIFDFADYGFNKSHSVAYSLVAYYTAYLKAHYPLEFLAISLECRKDEESERQLLAEECRRMNIKIKQPDINISDVGFVVRYNEENKKTGEIIYGLSAIKHVGEKAADCIISERRKNGEFKSFIDFLIRVDLRQVNKKVLENLIFAGAFDNIEKNRRKLLLNLDRATGFAQRYRETPEAMGQTGLFTNGENNYSIYNFSLVEHDDFTENEKYKNEREAIGFYLSGHPLDNFRKEIQNFVNLTFGEDPTEVEFNKLGTAKMCGVITNLEIKTSKKGNKFVTFKLVDLYGTGECVAFGSIFSEKEHLFKEDNLVFVEGKAEDNGDKIRLTVDNIYSLENFKEKLATNITIHLNENKISADEIKKIFELIKNNPGECNLYFYITGNGKQKLLKSKEYKIKITNELISNLKDILGEDNLSVN